MLGAAGIQIAFNVSNATSAAIGGLVINRGYGVESTALTGIPFALTGMVCFLLLYRKFRTQEHRCRDIIYMRRVRLDW